MYQKNYLPGKTGTENNSFEWTRVKKSVNLKKVVKAPNAYKLGFLPKTSDFFRSIYSSWNIYWCLSPNFLFLVGVEKASFYEAKLRKTEYAFV